MCINRAFVLALLVGFSIANQNSSSSAFIHVCLNTQHMLGYFQSSYMYLFPLPICSLLFSLPLRLIFLQHQISSSIQPLLTFLQFSIFLLSHYNFPSKEQKPSMNSIQMPTNEVKKIYHLSDQRSHLPIATTLFSWLLLAKINNPKKKLLQNQFFFL